MYQKRTNKETKESAVSPVVGVMLMLVVTIVIAAVVTVFATGLVGDTTVAPTISASVDLNTNAETITLSFTQVSEPIATSDLQLNLKSTKFAFGNDGDTVYKLYTETCTLGSSGAIVAGTTISKPLALGDQENKVNISSITGSGDMYVSEALETANETYFTLFTTKNSTDTSRFDLFEVINGEATVIAQNTTSTHPIINSMTKIQGSNAGTQTKQYATCNPRYSFTKNVNVMQEVDLEKLEAGDKVDVELLHIPSNSIVYAKTITVGA